jgi:hypothetical protein
LWSGLIALINQIVGKPLGYINPFIAIFASNPEGFHSITEGNNGGYDAGPGWNACAGLGTPHGTQLAALFAQNGERSTLPLESAPPVDTQLVTSDERREITVTGHTWGGVTVDRFNKGETYRLRCRVDAPAAGNLVVGDFAVEHIPESGLETRWVITSSNVEFIPALTRFKVEKVGNIWRAEFDLLIPPKGASETRELVVAGPEGPGDLQVALYTLAADESRELYREVTVDLRGAPTVTDDVISKSPQYTHLKTTHEWTTPSEHVQLSMRNGVVDVSTKRYRLEDYGFVEPFAATDTLLRGAIDNVRDSLEKFRELQGAYLENLDANDMRLRLQGPAWRPNLGDGGWQLTDGADTAHQTAFEQVRHTEEWRALASDGYALFDRCFPQDTQVRALLGKMKPGNRIDFHWTEQSGPGFVSHVPWALMYMEPVDVTGEVAPDPEKFLGLRFRIGSRSWRVNNGSVVLGGLDEAHAISILYWGRREGDDVGVEAQWQAGEYGGAGPSKLVPDPNAPDLKRQIILAFDNPGPSPVALIYFYCQCSVGDGAQPCLRFGNTGKYPPAKPGALGCEPLKAVGRVADAAR